MYQRLKQLLLGEAIEKQMNLFADNSEDYPSDVSDSESEDYESFSDIEFDNGNDIGNDNGDDDGHQNEPNNNAGDPYDSNEFDFSRYEVRNEDLQNVVDVVNPTLLNSLSDDDDDSDDELLSTEMEMPNDQSIQNITPANIPQKSREELINKINGHLRSISKRYTEIIEKSPEKLDELELSMKGLTQLLENMLTGRENLANNPKRRKKS